MEQQHAKTQAGTTDHNLHPFFSFFGSKWRLAPSYPRPEASTIIEPFAGSAGYSLRYPAHRVKLFDIDPVVVGVWKYLIAVSERELLRLPDVRRGELLDDSIFRKKPSG